MNSTGSRKQETRNSGFSTLEALIAVTVLTLSISTAALLIFGSQAFAVDTATNTDALSMVVSLLENARANAAVNFGSVVSASLPGSPYSSSLTVDDNGQCEKWAIGTITWNVGRPQTISLITDLSDPALALALGGDCGAPPGGGGPEGGGPTWSKPQEFAGYAFHSAQPASIDVLDRIVYITDNKKHLQIADTSGATLGFNGSFVSPEYDATPSPLQNLNDVDVIKWHDAVTGVEKRYAFVARNENPQQFQVIDVTTINNPVLKASRTLGGANPPSGANSEGWRLYYFGDRVYVATRETGGFEFHIFNVADPTTPSEVGSGLEINGTTNNFVVIATTVNGNPHRAAFLGMMRDTKELMVLDVTRDTAPAEIASLNLPGSADVDAVYVLGNKLYLGRDSNSGPELLVYDISYGEDGAGELTASLTQVGLQDISDDVTDIRVFSKFAFLATEKSNDELQIWDIRSPSMGITRVDTSPLGLANKIIGGIDYEDPYLYVTSQAGDSLSVVYSAP